ncbi:DUF2177 family protein [Candidatus Gracilibacteria bacterium]|nr:DUF2177 family protein [Candidatus Gracilibacteria bacterium]
MEIIKIFGVYFIGFITLLILDYIWLGYITKDFIIREFGNLVTIQEDGSIKINLVAGLTAWIIISAMIVTFVTLKYDNIGQIALYGALLGFMSYAMYDLTNLTFINNYSLKFTIVDILWGTFACMMIAINSFYFYNLIK